VKLLAIVAALQLLATCAGPPYDRPDAALPPVYPDAVVSPGAGPTFGDVGWWELFKDPELLSLERAAVARNQDVLVAAKRSLRASR